MAVVTPLEIYLDDNLKKILDLFELRIKKKWDNVIIISGVERAGKTTLAFTMANYLCHLRNQTFTLDNVFFDPEKMLNLATTTSEQVIVWDEAAFGGMSTQWHSRIQQKVNTMLMVTGKYRHTYIFIIPTFFKLNRYLAIDRSIGLINVYTPDLLSRGTFCLYNRTQKAYIYNNNRKSESFGRVSQVNGKFTLKNTEKILDVDLYEEKKDNAILKYLKSDASGKDELKELKYKVATRLPYQKVMELCDVSKPTVFNWRKYKENEVLV